MNLLSEKRVKLSIVGVIGLIGSLSGILTDVPMLARNALADAPSWMQNPKVQWCAAVAVIWAYVMWHIWRKPDKSQTPPEPEAPPDFPTALIRVAREASPQAAREAMVLADMERFQDRVRDTPRDDVNQEYVRNMIEVVYPQRIAEGVSGELSARYVESVKKIRKKQGQHVVDWSLLVFQSAFQLVKDEIWGFVQKEHEVKQKAWRPVFLPDAMSTVATSFAIGINIIATIVTVLNPQLSKAAVGWVMVGSAVVYGLLIAKRHRLLLGILNVTQEEVPTPVRKVAELGVVIQCINVGCLLLMAAVYFATNQRAVSMPPFPSIIVGDKMLADLAGFEKQAAELLDRRRSGDLTDEQLEAGKTLLDEEAARLLDVEFPALIASYYGDEERNKYQREIQLARQHEGSDDKFNLDIAADYIQALTLRESLKERQEYKAHLEKLHEEKDESNP